MTSLSWTHAGRFQLNSTTSGAQRASSTRRKNVSVIKAEVPAEKLEDVLVALSRLGVSEVVVAPERPPLRSNAGREAKRDESSDRERRTSELIWGC